MTTYTYLGYGTTDSNGVAKLDHDANGDAISHSYTGTGAGKIDVVASLEDISDLTINVNPSTINDNTSGTTHSISATVLKDGAAVQNENVTFELRKQSDNTLVETLTGTTNSSGIATVSYSGKHAGHLNIRPFCGTVVSQPYEVMDYIVYDTGKSGRDTTVWTNSNMAISTDENGTTLTRTGTGSYTSNVVMTGDFEAILQLKTNGTSIRVGIFDASQSNSVSHAIRNATAWSYFKLRRENGVLTAYESFNGSTWTGAAFERNNVGSNDCKFTFFITGSNERSITYKDLTILPI